MTRCALNIRSADGGRRAFSVMEMLVSMSILSIIVVGLMLMFQQTQKALRSVNMQTDVLETGRISMDLLTREIQMARASGLDGVTNFYFRTNLSSGTFPPLIQNLVAGETRPHTLKEIFFLTSSNQIWTAEGFYVNMTNLAGAGTLYRFHADPLKTSLEDTETLYREFERAVAKVQAGDPSTAMRRVADGVVHLECHVFNQYGVSYLPTNTVNITKEMHLAVFRGPALPYFIEVELGALEPQAWDQVKAMPPEAARKILTDRAGRVHLFRQRIPLRNALDQ